MAIRQVKVHGKKRWQARVAFQGARTSRLCGSWEEARQAEAELLQDLQAKVGQAEAEAIRPATLRQLCEAYAADLEARGKGPDTVHRAVTTARVLEVVLPKLMDQPVTVITGADVFAFRQARERAGIKASTINRDFKTLRAMLNQARPEFRFPGGAFLIEDETRVRWLRPEEELIVFVGMRSPFGEMARLACITLMRVGEVTRLRREQVRLEQGVVALPRAKAGSRHVVLSGEAQEILGKVLDSHRSEWVFPAPHGSPYHPRSVSRVWREASRAAGLQDFHFHDLRHHGATVALNAGFTMPMVMALGGWKTPKMMLRYAAVTDKTLRAAAEAVSGNSPRQQTANPSPTFSER